MDGLRRPSDRKNPVGRRLTFPSSKRKGYREISPNNTPTSRWHHRDEQPRERLSLKERFFAFLKKIGPRRYRQASGNDTIITNSYSTSPTLAINGKDIPKEDWQQNLNVFLKTLQKEPLDVEVLYQMTSLLDKMPDDILDNDHQEDFLMGKQYTAFQESMQKTLTTLKDNPHYQEPFNKTTEQVIRKMDSLCTRLEGKNILKKAEQEGAVQGENFDILSPLKNAVLKEPAHNTFFPSKDKNMQYENAINEIVTRNMEDHRDIHIQNFTANVFNCPLQDKTQHVLNVAPFLRPEEITKMKDDAKFCELMQKNSSHFLAIKKSLDKEIAIPQFTSTEEGKNLIAARDFLKGFVSETNETPQKTIPRKIARALKEKDTWRNSKMPSREEVSKIFLSNKQNVNNHLLKKTLEDLASSDQMLKIPAFHCHRKQIAGLSLSKTATDVQYINNSEEETQLPFHVTIETDIDSIEVINYDQKKEIGTFGKGTQATCKIEGHIDKKGFIRLDKGDYHSTIHAPIFARPSLDSLQHLSPEAKAFTTSATLKTPDEAHILEMVNTFSTPHAAPDTLIMCLHNCGGHSREVLDQFDIKDDIKEHNQKLLSGLLSMQGEKDLQIIAANIAACASFKQEAEILMKAEQNDFGKDGERSSWRKVEGHQGIIPESFWTGPLKNTLDVHDHIEKMISGCTGKHDVAAINPAVEQSSGKQLLASYKKNVLPHVLVYEKSYKPDSQEWLDRIFPKPPDGEKKERGQFNVDYKRQDFDCRLGQTHITNTENTKDIDPTEQIQQIKEAIGEYVKKNVINPLPQDHDDYNDEKDLHFRYVQAFCVQSRGADIYTQEEAKTLPNISKDAFEAMSAVPMDSIASGTKLLFNANTSVERMNFKVHADTDNIYVDSELDYYISPDERIDSNEDIFGNCDIAKSSFVYTTRLILPLDTKKPPYVSLLYEGRVFEKNESTFWKSS